MLHEIHVRQREVVRRFQVHHLDPLERSGVVPDQHHARGFLRLAVLLHHLQCSEPGTRRPDRDDAVYRAALYRATRFVRGGSLSGGLLLRRLGDGHTTGSEAQGCGNAGRE